MSKFQLGQVVITAGAKESLNRIDITNALNRHTAGDWGELDPEDKEINDQAVIDPAMILSAYRSIDKTKFWIVTEANRSVTTVLLPSEY